MKGLALWIFLTMQIANCLWYQDGHWTRQLSANKSFLFTFLDVEEGYAWIKGDRNSKNLYITLWQNKGSNKSVSIMLNMISERYQAVPQFHANNLTAATNFQTEDGTAYPQQEVNISTNLPFNVTITNRKQLKLSSSEGTFLIKLIDIEQVSPKIRTYLWQLLFLVFFLGQPYFLYFFCSLKSRQELNVWTLSSLLFIVGLARIIRGIFNQSLYFSDISYSQNLGVCSILVVMILTIEIVLSIVVIAVLIEKLKPPGHQSFAIVTIVMTVFLWITSFFTFIPLRLWHCLAVIAVYEIATLFNRNYEDMRNKCIVIIGLGIFYLFPCFIFPVFSFEIQYSKEEAEQWWLYGVLYLVEVIVFLLKSKECFKFKKLMNLKVQKQFNSQTYLKLEHKACSLCLKEVETSEIGMSLVEEVSQVNWIQAECGHHFHKACIRQNMHEDSCHNDNIKWTQEFKNAARR